MNIGTDYIRQLTAEKLVEHKNHRGQVRQVWHRTHRHNHYGDCEKMQLVEGYLLSSLLQRPLPVPPTEEKTPPPPGENPSPPPPPRAPAPPRLKRYLPFRRRPGRDWRLIRDF
jgi:hypothetical protein